jgi:hypothetical protein
MTDRAKFEQMLESLINGDQKQAEEIFHELVVAKSREIYENLLDDDIQVDEEKDEDEDEEVEENFDMDMQEVGGDPADDMMGDMGADDEGSEDDMDDMDDMGDEGGDDEPATKDDVMDIKDALDDLKAEFEAMLSGAATGDVDGDGDHDMDDHDAEDGDMDDEEEKKEQYQFEEDEDEEGVVREYVEKVAPAKMGDNGANSKSIVAGKNNMGGTTANIVKGGTEAGVMANQGQLKGSGLLKGTPKDLNSGNVNVPGSKNATKMSPTKGHGAEKKGAGEQAANTRSIVGK